MIVFTIIHQKVILLIQMFTKLYNLCLKQERVNSLCDNNSMKGFNTNNTIKPTEILCKLAEVKMLWLKTK